jgi:hypothetical protein
MWWKSEGGSRSYQEQAVVPSLVSTQVAPLQTQSLYKLVSAILPSITDVQATGALEFFVSFRDVRSAVPVIFAVIVPALKFPKASLATMALKVLAELAEVAELDTFPAVEIVARYESEIAVPCHVPVVIVPTLTKLGIDVIEF